MIKMIYVITICILLTVIIVLSFQCMKWYISTVSLLNWAARKGLTPPTIEELNRIVGIVVRDMIKNFFKGR